MRAANIFVGSVAAIWFVLFWLGRDLIRGVYLQGLGIAPNAEQLDYYLVYPLVAVLLLLIAGWSGNVWRKPAIMFIPALLIGFAILPFLLGYTGGM